ncbi:MAG: dihydroxyacetone kinase subunit DhaL [Chitinophagales bacterium]
METFAAADFRAILARMADLMAEQKDYLTELDGVIGDGDLGLTMSKGFRAVADAVAALDESDVGKLLGKAGMTMASTVPSTMGTLMATGLMRAGKAAVGKTEVTLADLAAMLTDFVEGLIQRGKAQPGDKTIIDALAPAAAALRSAAESGRSLAEGWESALAAARSGLEETKKMISQHGKAACFQEKSLGQQDPGATVGAFLIQAFAAQAQ